MNCDQAFDCLTDPRRRETPELGRHLDQCPRCRTMRDTLEPALDLFDDLAVEPDLSAYAPGGLNAAAPETLQLAEQTAARLSATGRQRPSARGSWRPGLRYAAALLFGAGVALAIQSPVNEDVEHPGAGGCLWLNRSAADELNPTSRAVTAQCMSCHFELPDRGFGPAASSMNPAGFFRLTASRPRLQLATLIADWRSDPAVEVTPQQSGMLLMTILDSSEGAHHATT